MVLHIIESGRHGRTRPWWTGWSAAAHAAVIVGVSGGVPATTPEERPPVERVQYILPQLPSTRHADRPDANLQWPGQTPVTVRDPSALGQQASAPRRSERVGRSTDPDHLPGALGTEGDEVRRVALYLEPDVEESVERDPMSDGPRYPEELLVTRTEGHVVADWVVDSTGRADTTTFQLVEVHGDARFGASVREAIPRMRFKPARIAGRPVAQFVRETFRFQMAPIVRVPAPATPALAAPAPR